MKLKIEDILFWIFFILAVILFLWYIFGKLPTFEQSILVFVLGWIIKLHGEIKEVATRLEEHIRGKK